MEDPAKNRHYENQLKAIQNELDVTRKQLSRYRLRAGHFRYFLIF